MCRVRIFVKTDEMLKELKEETGNHDFDDSFGSLDGSREKEFMGLIVSTQRHIFSYIIAMVPNRSDAEDILQDTMTVMWRKFEDFKPGSNFIAWGITIAKYRIMKYRSRKYSSNLCLDDDVLELLDKQSGRMIGIMDKRLDALKNCVKKLDSKEVDFLKMRYEQDMSFRKVASLVGLTSTAVFKSISRIHYKLMLCIKRTLFMEPGS